MHTRRAILLWVVVVGLLAAGSVQARVYDHLFRYGFDQPDDAPASDAEAARFLTQATFGPSVASIARLKALGYSEWFAEQLGSAPTLARPFIQDVAAARTADGQNLTQTSRVDRWLWTAVYGQDQLRQRMAWALSQIFVVSDQNSSISSNYIPMAEYADLLARDAFGSYRTLLGDVTLSPTMGKFLSHFRNQKPSSTTQPDENYAREVMQLFSVGLVQRNLDYSPVLDDDDNPVPTYDQTVITHTAKVFTGFTYSDAPTNPANFYGGALTDAGSYNPMACWGTELFASGSNMRHDITGDDGTTGTPKTVLGGLTIPANQTCAQDVGDELDIIAGHVNVAPFVSRQLIQRFVTSNPSPAYIQRVASVFEDNGAPEHERGDLGAVVLAILTDSEARNPDPAATYGKLREPLLRITAMWRAWGAQAPTPNQYGEILMSAGNSLLSDTGQRPLGAPTVFNFYTPDYQQPGTFADQNLYTPEFEIVNEATVYTSTNLQYKFTKEAYVGMDSPPTNRPLLNLTPLTNLATDPAAMVDLANARMMYGTMGAHMHDILVNTLTFMSGASTSERAWTLVYLISLSPEYAAQR